MIGDPGQQQQRQDRALADWAIALTDPDRPPHEFPQASSRTVCLRGPRRGQARRRPHRTYRDTWLEVAALLDARAATADAKSDALEPSSDARRRVTAWSCGVSHKGQPIWAIDVAPPGAVDATTLVVAGLHAMEHVGVATAVALLERAASADSPWRKHRLVVVPMANPDGFLAVEQALAAGQRRFRRTNAAGVDLNRNFAVGWDDRYYLNRLLRPVFSPGSGPLSEPESRAVNAVLTAVRPTYAVSLHAFGEWIFVPYAGSRRPPAALALMLTLARGMAMMQPQRPYRVMQLGLRSRLFQARGAEIDHFYDRYNALSFLIEIGAGPRLRAPGTWLHPYSWFTPPAPLLERDVANVLPAIEFLGRVA